VQDEFTGRGLPQGLEESLPNTLEELFARTRAGVRRSAELYINVCQIMDRLVKRQEGVAAATGAPAQLGDPDLGSPAAASVEHPPRGAQVADQLACVACVRVHRERVERTLAVLEPDVTAQVRAMLTSGWRIAQERCGRELLARLPGWWDPHA
jgi:hypothetical protein